MKFHWFSKGDNLVEQYSYKGIGLVIMSAFVLAFLALGIIKLFF